MTQRYFFDTSALIKLYHREEGTDTLDKLVEDNQPVIVISDLSILEMISALAKKVRTQEIDEKIFEVVTAAFESDISAFEVINVDQKVKMTAVTLLKTRGLKQGLRTLDAIQLASALEGAEETLDLFLTSDNVLVRVAEMESLPVLLV